MPPGDKVGEGSIFMFGGWGGSSLLAIDSVAIGLNRSIVGNEVGVAVLVGSAAADLSSDRPVCCRKVGESEFALTGDIGDDATPRQKM